MPRLNTFSANTILATLVVMCPIACGIGTRETDQDAVDSVSGGNVDPGQAVSAAELKQRLDTLKDGEPVTVTGTIATIHVANFNWRTGEGVASLNLLAPSPLEPQELGYLDIHCVFASADDLKGLVEEQSVVLTGVVDVDRRSRSLRGCRLVSRGDVPEYAPKAVDVDKVGASEGETPAMPEGVGINRLEGFIEFEKAAVAEDGAVPQAAVDAVKDDQRFNAVVTQTPITNAALQQINAVSGLKELLLMEQSGDESLDFSLLAEHPRLRHIEVHVDQFTNDNLSQIGGLKCCAALVISGASLFDGCDLSGTTDDGVRGLARLKSLRFLTLEEKRKGEPSQITDDGLTALGELPRLTALDLWSESFNGAGLAALSACPDLWSLRLSKCSVTADGLASLKELSSLMVLNLSETEVDSTIGQTISQLPNLTTLDLSKTKVDDELAASLAGQPALASLNLRYNPAVTDKTLKTLAENPPPHLRNLQLSGTQVTDEGVKLLTTVKTLRFLLTGNTSDAVKESLRQANPELQIY
ncbi:MAG: hypothetical protein H8E44_48040 [Planctomycetes bacterium]|nr:hypothetical protein [Planctomycetota bacterium]MBL7037880.1 hypothetical protein [Pirellulaceae bacterium]